MQRHSVHPSLESRSLRISGVSAQRPPADLFFSGG
jgi:hypothetical protein